MKFINPKFISVYSDILADEHYFDSSDDEEYVPGEDNPSDQVAEEGDNEEGEDDEDDEYYDICDTDEDESEDSEVDETV